MITHGGAIVVVNYGSHRLLESGLTGLGDQLIIVVDNFSILAERTAITRLAADRGWELVALPGNGGFGQGVNAGVRRASELGASSVILLNPDAILTAEVADALHRHCADRPNDLVTPRLIDSAGRSYFTGSFVELDSGTLRGWRRKKEDGPVVLPSSADRMPWLTATCLAMSIDLWRRVDGMAEDYFLYWEDVDFSVRCVRAGARLVVRDDLVAVHDEGGTQTDRPLSLSKGPAKSDLYYRYNCRNRLLFANRMLTRGRQLRWALTTPRESWRIYLRGGRRQLLAHPAGLLAAIRGALSGLGLLIRPARTRTKPALPRPEPVEGQDHRRAQQPSPRVLLANPGADLYGSDRMLIESAEGLRADGWQVTVVLPYRGPLLSELTDRGFDVVTSGLPALRKSILNPVGLIRFMTGTLRHSLPAIRLIRRFGSDLVQVNTMVVPAWLVLARLAGRPAVCHIHEAERQLPRPVRRLLTAPVGLADRVIVNSRFTAEVLASTLVRIRSRTEVVYNGLTFGPLAPPRSELVGRVRLVFCGRLSRRKGPQTVITAVQELVDQGLDVELDLIGSVVAGHEWFETELRDLAEPLGDRVRFLGFRPDSAELVGAADIVVVPSIGDESYGNAAVEAAAAGRPVIITDQPGMVEAVGSLPSVRTVPPDRAGDIAEAIAETIKEWESSTRAAVVSAERVRADHATSRYRHDVATVARATIR